MQDVGVSPPDEGPEPGYVSRLLYTIPRNTRPSRCQEPLNLAILGICRKINHDRASNFNRGNFEMNNFCCNMDIIGVSFKESIDQITGTVGQHLNAVKTNTTGNHEYMK